MASTTTSSTLTNTIKSFYDRVMLDTLDQQLRFHQFGVKRPLPKAEGKSVIWNLPYRLALGSLLTEGTAFTTGNALSTYKVSAVIRQYGGVNIISDIVELTSITDVMKLAAERAGKQAALTIDRMISNECFVSHVTTTGGAPHHLIKTSTGVTEVWGAISGCSYTTNGALAGDELTAQGCYSNLIAVSDIRKAIYKLKSLYVPPYEGNDYVAIANVETIEDIVGDSTWVNYHQYAAPGQANLYSGEVGKILGCRFVETNNGPIARGVGDSLSTASALVYGTVIMGAGFYGVTELDGGIKTYLVQGADKSDMLNQTTTYGWKASIAAKVLNVSAGLVLWAGSGDTTIIATESAGSGTRCENLA